MVFKNREWMRARSETGSRSWITPPPPTKKICLTDSNVAMKRELIDLGLVQVTLKSQRSRLHRILGNMDTRSFDVLLTIRAQGKLKVKLNGDREKGVKVVAVEADNLPHGLTVGDVLVNMNGLDMRKSGIESVHQQLKSKSSPHVWTFQRCMICVIDRSELGLRSTVGGIEVARGISLAKSGDLIRLKKQTDFDDPITVMDKMFAPTKESCSFSLTRIVNMAKPPTRNQNEQTEFVSHRALTESLLSIESELKMVCTRINHLTYALKHQTPPPSCSPLFERRSTTLENISAICPISSKRIRVPVLGNACGNHRCFDRDAFKAFEAMQENFVQVKCPICHNYVNKLIPDLAFQKILQIHPEIENYLVERDATGTPIRYIVKPSSVPDSKSVVVSKSFAKEN